MNKNKWVLIAVTLLLASCSSEDNKPVEKPKKELAIFNEQVQALEKAKGVESMLQETEALRRKEIEKATQ
jgi:PBP1b-binding outer membrane lipoprotein LpoB